MFLLSFGFQEEKSISCEISSLTLRFGPLASKADIVRGSHELLTVGDSARASRAPDEVEADASATYLLAGNSNVICLEQYQWCRTLCVATMIAHLRSIFSPSTKMGAVSRREESNRRQVSEPR